MVDLTFEKLQNNTQVINDEDINLKCVFASGGVISFPCDISAPVAVSVAIGAGGLALLFVMYLVTAVSLLSQGSSVFLKDQFASIGGQISTGRCQQGRRERAGRTTHLSRLLVMFVFFITHSLTRSLIPRRSAFLPYSSKNPLVVVTR